LLEAVKYNTKPYTLTVGQEFGIGEHNGLIVLVEGWQPKALAML